MKNKLLNIVFATEVLFFALVVTGIIPRSTVLYFTAFLSVYVLWAKTEDSAVFFTRSIPLFLAIPFTPSFDNFNTWRIISALIFLKWGFLKFRYSGFEILNKIKKFRPETKLLVLLGLLATLSVISAPDKTAAIKRVIYFANLSLMGIVIYDLSLNRDFIKRFIKNLAVPVIIVTAVGFIQIASTYFMDIYQFMRIWGENIQCRQFGNQWCNIAVWEGNTWFAYYGSQLSLRVFSLFTDSHTFPMFILLGLPAIFALSLPRVIERSKNLREMIWTRGRLFVLWIPAIFLMAILSGTRGIWAASIGVVILSVMVLYKLPKPKKPVFKYISLYLIIFFLLFSLAYPIFVSPQFLVSKGNWGLFGNRIRSIIDFGETSNGQRLEIWRKSWESIKKHPLLGVGIGNFPVVLGQDIKWAKAGSSAHNLYIQIAAEMGLIAAGTAIWFLWSLFSRIYQKFVKEGDAFMSVYYGASLLFVPWILIYLLTDAALFDERAFLMFAVITGTILARES